MKKILLINAHQKYPYAEGKLNQTLHDFMFDFLSPNYEIQKTNISEPYNMQTEIDKFVQSDIIIIQTPIFWFNIGGKLKTYIDEVFQHGIFFIDQENKDYGDYGLFTNKKYMFSFTWNSPEKAFNNPSNRLFNGRSSEDVVFNLHATMQFVGMQPIKSFNAHNVVHEPNISLFLSNLEKHLQQNFKH